MSEQSIPPQSGASLLDRIILACMQNQLLVALVVAFFVGWGIMVAPFDWHIPGLPRTPVSVDAIPDLGENQQIVFADWEGRSPQNVEDQITYPLTVALLGLPGVKTVRSTSMFGFASVNIIFDEGIEFYWARSRVLEKLSTLAEGTLPEGVTPMLGPDATGLGQIFWYTLEGHDPEGVPVGGWGPQELRSLQDWYVRYGLLAAHGVSEVASIGGFVAEYQIDVDPDAMRAYGVTLDMVFNAVRSANADVGASTIEVNRVEYLIRGLGFIERVEDIEQTVVAMADNAPITVAQIAQVTRGPAPRLGVLDKGGAEATGGVVVSRHLANPLETINAVKAKITEIAPGLPTRAVVIGDTPKETVNAFAEAAGFAGYDAGALNQDAWMRWLHNTPRAEWPEWITTSQVRIVPFYDRTGLIKETLGTLEDALTLQILITILVVLVMLMHLRSSLLISAILPLAVLVCFIGMKLLGVQANVVALSGIAIAIGTLVDMGIILCENMVRRLDEAPPGSNRFQVVYEATSEVGSAVLTAVATTVVGFLPVFTMTGAEGKMFTPLAYTKTLCLLASVVLAITIMPTLGYLVLAGPVRGRLGRMILALGAVLAGLAAWRWAHPAIGAPIVVVGLYYLLIDYVPTRLLRWGPRLVNLLAIVVVGYFLTQAWLPLGPERSFLLNGLFVAGLVGGLLGLFHLFQLSYAPLLRWFLNHKLVYLTLPVAIVLIGAMTWLGTGKVWGWLPEGLQQTPVYASLYHAFPGLGKQFMPPLDEGSFLYMPTTMPHASIGEALEVVQLQDKAFASIPEVDSVVGKAGRVDSALDPAPVSMIETLINYKAEYKRDADGRRINYRYDETAGTFPRDAAGELIPDPEGRPFRQWRDHIRTPEDIWKEIVAAGMLPGTTSAPMLQPIITRIIMLQSGMRAPMGVKVKGPDLETIERVGMEIEALLREVPGVSPASVFAERIVGKPYLEIDIDRAAIARYGLSIDDVQMVIEVAIGGMPVTQTVEGRERYPVRIRYAREHRDDIETLNRILVPTMEGAQIPLAQLAAIRYVRGPQMIKSEDTFLTGYVTFDKDAGTAEVDVVEACRAHLDRALASGAWRLPPGVSYTFAGNYENQIRAAKTLALVLPLSLFIIFIILYLQFRDTITTGLVFLGILVAWSGGFVMLWLYAQPWFLDVTLADVHLRTLFQVHPILLSVAIWVGFLALFGIASDDGVVMATYLQQSFDRSNPATVPEIRAAVLEAGIRRIRPCLMTTATTILALLPVLTSTGRGADIMIPMAIPTFGGMTIELLTLFLVPVLYCAREEWKLRFGRWSRAVEKGA